MQEDLFDVAVIGYGPTGMVLASLLGGKGHRVVVLERWPTLYGMPRLTHIDGETARLLSFACDIEAALKDSSPIQSFEFMNAGGIKLLDVSAIPTLPMGYPAHISIHQPDIETALDERIRSFNNVHLLQGAEVLRLEPGTDAVSLTARVGGEDRTLKARFVFGADGARSFTRQALGIDRKDFGFNERWLNVDCERKRALPTRFDGAKQYCDPARGHMFMPIGEKRQRFEFAVLQHETTESMEVPEAAWKMLQRYHGLGPDDVSIIRQIVYTFECRLARSWRSGRVLLGGDAVHTMPPYLGQGACSGIRDAANLAWKLDLVLRGHAPDTLLGAYEAERRDHAAYIMKTSRAFGKIANTHNRIAAFVRDLVFRLKLLPTPRPFPAMTKGILQSGRNGAAGKAVGTVPPQGRVSTGNAAGLLDVFTGYDFALIARTDPLASLSESHKGFLRDLGCRIFTLSDNASEGAMRLKDDDATYIPYLRQMERHAMLTRPDGNVFGFAETAEQLGELVDELRALLAWREAKAPQRAAEKVHEFNG